MGLVRYIAAVSSRLRSLISSKPGNPRHILGRRGEAVAARYLRRLGYKVLYRNYRAPGGGEVDIVCRERDVLVFVEVKTRSSETGGAPAESVTRAKQQLIIRGAHSWLKLLDRPDICYRFDIVEVRAFEKGTEVNVIRNAFAPPEIYR